jgi:hypothetical protein
MVNKSTKFNKTKYCLSPETINTKKTMTYTGTYGNLGPWNLGQTQEYDGVKPTPPYDLKLHGLH